MSNDNKYSPQETKWVARLGIALAIVFAICGLAALGVSFASFDAVRSLVNQYAFDGNADYLTPERYHGMAVRLRMAGATVLVLAGVMVWLRRIAGAALLNLAAGFWGLLREFTGVIKSWQRDDPIWFKAAVWAVLALALFFRLLYLQLPITYDEATTFMEWATRPIPIALSYYTAPNNHLFHTLLIALLRIPLGDSLTVLRLPVLIAGMACLVFSYVFIRRLYGRSAGLIGLALMAASPAMVHYSVTARGYGLVALFFMMMLTLQIRLRHRATPAGCVLWGLLAALSLWSVPTALFAVGGAAMLWLFSPQPGTRGLAPARLTPILGALAVGAVLTLLLYTPVMLGSGLSALMSRTDGNAGSWHLISRLFMDIKQLITWGWPGWLGAVICLLALAGVVRHLRIHKSLLDWPPLPVLIGCMTALAVLVNEPGPARMWLFLVPLAMGSAAASLAWLMKALPLFGRWKPAPALAAVVLALALALTTWSGQILATTGLGGTFRQAGAVADYLQANWQKGDSVLAHCPADEPLAYQFHLRGMPVDAAFAVLNRTLDQARRVFVVEQLGRGLSLNKLLQVAGDQLSAFKPPRQVLELGTVRLYVMQKK